MKKLLIAILVCSATTLFGAEGVPSRSSVSNIVTGMTMDATNFLNTVGGAGGKVNAGALTNLHGPVSGLPMTNNTALEKIFIGPGAGASTSGTLNLGVGINALSASTAAGNTAYGHYALQNNTGGAQQTAFGKGALALNTVGQGNSAFGYESLFNNTTGDYNAAFGQDSLFSCITGSSNTAVGLSVMVSMLTGQNNTGVGYGVLAEGFTNGIGNTIVGTYGAINLNAGSGNTIIGDHAGTNLLLGSGNILIGEQAQSPIPGLGGVLNIGNVIYGLNLWTNIASASINPQASGKIGIGITNPVSTLEVSGDITATNGVLRGMAYGNLFNSGATLVLPASGSDQTLTNYQGLATNGFTGSVATGSLTNSYAGVFSVSFDVYWVGVGNGTQRSFIVTTNGISVLAVSLNEYESTDGFTYHVSFHDRILSAPDGTRWELKTTTADSVPFTNTTCNLSILGLR